MAIWLYHQNHKGDERHGHAQGRLFSPTPSSEAMEALVAKGWRDAPHKLPGFTAAPSAGERDYDIDATDVDVEAAPREQPLKDIRTIAAIPAREIIDTISSRDTLLKIRAREAGSPKGGRKSVLEAIDARLEQI